jgi:transposase-like protein
MPQNPIQFQHGMSMSEFIAAYGSEAKCAAALQQARWPDGFVCPECGAREHSSFLADGRRDFQCAHCRAQSTRRSGTLFHASRLPLVTWFQALYLVTQNKNCLSALSLKRHLGVSYRTAWRVKHKLLEARPKREDVRPPVGLVVADDAYLVGVHAGKRGRGSENKVPFIAAVELDADGHPPACSLRPHPGRTSTRPRWWRGPARPWTRRCNRSPTVGPVTPPPRQS